MEKIAAGTEGLQLESSDRTEVMGSLAEVGQGGGAAAAVGGGGGGGAAIPDKPVPPVPDVSQSEPSQALASISNLPPAQLLGALGGVSAAVGNTVGKQRAELAANPPQMEQPTGAPTKEGAAGDRPLPQAATPKPVEKAPEGQAQPVPQPQPITLPPPPTVKAVSPPVKGDAEGKVSANDAEAMKASLRQIPTTDPNLQVNAGAPPPLELTGNADPQKAQEQKAKLEQGVTAAHTQGQQELAQPMGENEIYPQIVPETLKAEGIGGNRAAPKAPVIEGVVGDDAVSIIAQQEHGAEIQAAVAQAQGQISAKQQEHTAQVAHQKATNQQEIAKLQQENTAQQSAERSKAQAEVQKQKEDWNKEQTDLVAKSRADAEAEIAKGNKEVEQEQTQAEAKASEHIEKGNTEAEAARKQGEKDAEQERSKGEKESGGIFGWLADKAKSFFDGIKQAIQKAFEIARAAVKAAIETAQKLATAVIEAARQAIVSVIKRVGDALIALGDVLLAAFPEMRDRFRNAIKATVQAAEAAVNALAKNLKKGVQAALNLLGKGLDAALGLLEKGYLMAVDFASKAVQGAISAAKAAVDVLGTFAVLIKDIAGNPGQWLSNLGAGAKDGVQNHLWTAFQVAVQAWFGQKVEEVLGLGMTVWNVLNQGGIKVEEVGAMAWEGIKSAIPPALIQLLIEKVVSMIIPAAGTVMLIIEGLQAAWGTVSRILQAMEKFITFLKAVKSGQSGPQFAEMLAAAGVVLIDFVSNWLLAKLKSAGSKVAAKVREIAKKIGKKLKKTLKKLKRKLGKVKNKFFGKKGNKGGKDSKHGKDKKHDQDQDKEKKKQEKLDKAVRELQPKIRSLLGRGASGLRIRGQLAIWRIQYGLSRLDLLKNGKNNFRIIAQVNPKAEVMQGVQLHQEELLLYVRQVIQEVINHPTTQKAATEILNIPKPEPGEIPNYTISQEHNVSAVLAAAQKMDKRNRGTAEILNFPGNTKELDTQVRREQGRGSTRNKLVYKITDGKIKDKDKADYISLGKELDDIGKTPNERRQLAGAIEAWTKSRIIPEGFEQHKDVIAQMGTLMGVQEAHRSKGGLAMAPFALDIAGQHSWEDILTGKNGAPIYPMAPKDSQKDAKNLDNYLGRWEEQQKGSHSGNTEPATEKRKMTLGSRQKAMMDREFDFIKAWLKTLDLKFADQSSEEEKIVEIKKNIRERILAFSGIDE